MAFFRHCHGDTENQQDDSDRHMKGLKVFMDHGTHIMSRHKTAICIGK